MLNPNLYQLLFCIKIFHKMECLIFPPLIRTMVPRAIIYDNRTCHNYHWHYYSPVFHKFKIKSSFLTNINHDQDCVETNFSLVFIFNCRCQQAFCSRVWPFPFALGQPFSISCMIYCLMPGGFTHQEESAATQWVKSNFWVLITS